MGQFNMINRIETGPKQFIVLPEHDTTGPIRLKETLFDEYFERMMRIIRYQTLK